MIVQDLIEAVVQTNDRVGALEKAIQQIAKDLSLLANRFGDPTGTVQLGARAKTSPADLKRMLDGGRMELEGSLIDIDVWFSSEVFMAVRPQNAEKLHEILDKAQLEYLKTNFERARALDAMLESSKARIAEENRIVADLRRQAEQRIEGWISEGNRSLAGKLEGAIEKIERKESSIERALKNVDLALDKANAAHAMAQNAGGAKQATRVPKIGAQA